jgi:hypothetical protein
MLWTRHQPHTRLKWDVPSFVVRLVLSFVRPSRYVQQSKQLNSRLKEALRESRELNRCRGILGQQLLDYDTVNRLIALTHATNLLWRTYVGRRALSPPLPCSIAAWTSI